jgi:hypothetical protein
MLERLVWRFASSFLANAQPQSDGYFTSPLAPLEGNLSLA